MEDDRLERRFLAAMTALSRLVLTPQGERTYDIAMDSAGQFITDFFNCDHGGAAYAIWMEVSDYLDDPRGPMTEQACEEVGRKVATEWLAVDQSSPESISDFFTRWRSPTPWPV
ncbi:hypothetical protein [Paenarthrobacter sp. A20]|uniref:hypothetical protein n=1 Tax=Paenarthrobacter sp. A20 TaxID=2817891 RepID=UPI0020A04FA1|nr:hypothetical protein [Paenarthrobacter sp. A20]MCP1413678.1 hypothetical protein [Paenarthrobacter sp. A20]